MKFFLIISFIACSLAVFGQTIIDTVYKPVAFPKGYESALDVVYTNVNGWEGKLDYYINTASTQPTPLVINIHGGGWNHGVKEGQGGFSPFFKEGFAVANIEYRLTPQATAPAAIEDARCALIYLINHAKQLNIDANKIVIMGGSAGGHLALMAGLLGSNSIFDNNCIGVQNIKVAVIIDKYGIADVWDWGYGKNITSKSALTWLGEKKLDSLFAASVSPINYVYNSSPPTLIIHGDADPTVPYQQSIALYEKYKSVGVKCAFISVTGGLHGKFTKEKNDELNIAIMKFIFEVIK